MDPFYDMFHDGWFSMGSTDTNTNTTSPCLDIDDMLTSMRLLQAKLPNIQPVPEIMESAMLTVPAKSRTASRRGARGRTRSTRKWPSRHSIPDPTVYELNVPDFGLVWNPIMGKHMPSHVTPTRRFLVGHPATLQPYREALAAVCR